jgi:hypothetical protein
MGEVVREADSRRTAALVSIPMALTDFSSYVAESGPAALVPVFIAGSQRPYSGS